MIASSYISIIERLDGVSCTFFKNYESIVRDLRLYCEKNSPDAEYCALVSGFLAWYEDEGQPYILESLRNWDNISRSQLEGFCDCHQLLLENSKDDLYKLLDQMFSIPNELVEEFGIALSLSSRIHGDAKDNDIKFVTINEFNIQGNHSEGSLFM